MAKYHEDHYAIYENYPTNILTFKSDGNSSKTRINPTQKPVALLEYLIKTYTDEGETVLDNCMGSGSCGVACVHTNRDFIGMELNDTFYEKACEWIHKEQAAWQYALVPELAVST